MGNTQTSLEIADELELPNGSQMSEKKGNTNKNYKISALLDYIANKKNFDFKVHLKFQQFIENESNQNPTKNNFNLKCTDKRLKNDSSIYHYVDFNSLEGSYNSINPYLYKSNNLLSFTFNSAKKSTLLNLPFIKKENHSETLSRHDETINANFETNKNIMKTFTRLKEEHDRILSGKIIKAAFVGRQNNCIQLLNSFFINEKNSSKVDIYSADPDPSKYSPPNDNRFNYKSTTCCPPNVSNSYCFFSNIDYINFYLNYFISFHKKENFGEDCKFNNKCLFQGLGRGKSVDFDLANCSNFIKYLCEYDFVIYCIDKTNEDIQNESRYLEYLIKKFPIFKYMIEKKRFFIVLNKMSSEKNILYTYQNAEANSLLNKLNTKFDNNLIFEVDLNKTFEEKIIYFYKIIKKYDRKYLFEKNFPIKDSKNNNNEAVVAKNLQNCSFGDARENNSNTEIKSPSALCLDKNNPSNSDNNKTNKTLSLLESNTDTDTAYSVNFSCPNFDFNQNFFTISEWFEKILTKKFIIKHWNNIDSSNPDKFKSKAFYEFYEHFINSKISHAYGLNKAQEFDKFYYDTLNDLLMLKFENFYQEYKLERLLNEMTPEDISRIKKQKNNKYCVFNNDSNCKKISNRNLELEVLNEVKNAESNSTEDHKHSREDEANSNITNFRFHDIYTNEFSNNMANNQNKKEFFYDNNRIKSDNIQNNDIAKNMPKANISNKSDSSDYEFSSEESDSEISHLQSFIMENQDFKEARKKNSLNSVKHLFKGYSKELISNRDEIIINSNKHDKKKTHKNLFAENNKISLLRGHFKAGTDQSYFNKYTEDSLDITSENSFQKLNNLKSSFLNINTNKKSGLISNNKHKFHCHSCCDLNEEKQFSKKGINEKIDFLKNKINLCFEFMSKELSSNVSTFLPIFKFLNDKLDNIKSISSESKNLRGKKIRRHSHLNFLFEIFDLHGINDYHSSISSEIVEYYNSNLKKMFLHYIKILNHSIIRINSLESSIINIHEDLKYNFESNYEVLPKMNFNNYFTEKFQSQKFFHYFFFKIFSLKEPKLKPVFAYNNISNMIGFLTALMLLIKAIKQLFYYSPDQIKILKLLAYSIASIISTYLISVLLNKFSKSNNEKNLLKLSQKLGNNTNFIINHLSNMEKWLEDYRTNFIGYSINFLTKLKDKM